MAKHYSLLEHLLFPPKYCSAKQLKKAIGQKNIVITGASYGIGEAIAYQLASNNVHLILVARTDSKLRRLKTKLEALGATISIYSVDLSQEREVCLLIDHLKQQHNGIDIVISNAGHSIKRSIHDSLERFHDFQRTMAINYFGPVQLLLALIPLLKKNKGHIINISAVNVLLIPAPHWSAYQASKAAFDQWFRSVSLELKSDQISCSTVYLPLVKTRMIAPTPAYAKAPAMSPQHVAKIVGRLIYTKRRKFAPWWLFFGQLGSLLFRNSWEFWLPLLLKKR
ncbi:SDR family NAD(P)-dependent oxidoreductase [Aureispira anguillae]|uniref:SDR family NAD(P)-dependent oxidoreductase n=1 Tax=Aureispira anguillae TaxID=2864201 RepID=A0A915VK55_9BACT|nr:SDR family NAD(P)-dependent oxidoreductase [Aureispira anguillae]BDS09410.1 SDR family NAD(P)-dependent oxidoreductase [Aureispira anguillae]